jgi:hypothetical protein
MGNLTHAALALATTAGTLIVNGSAAPDPNDRVFFFDTDQRGATHAYTASVPGGFRTAVVSWNVSTPNGSGVEVTLSAHVDGHWTREYAMGLWSSDASGGRRHSIADQNDADGSVDTDTLTLNAPADAYAVHVAELLGPRGAAPVLRLVTVATSLAPDGERAPSTGGAIAVLDVPERTQRIPASPDAKGGGGDSWCSPTSVSMVMAYWAHVSKHPEWDVDVSAVADGVYDPVYDGCGNWPFNVAFASEHGLAGFVRQLPSLAEAAILVSRGIPVIASIAVKPGELDGTPYPKTEGHLLVIRGFTAAGDVIVNDPYGKPGEIRRVYRRAQFEHVWQGGSNGTVYVIAPPDVVRSLR